MSELERLTELLGQGRLAEAVQLAAAAVEQARAEHGEGTPGWAEALYMQGCALARSQPEEAEAVLKQALAVPVEGRSAALRRLDWQLRYAEVLCSLGRYDQAETVVRANLEGREALHGKNSTGFALGLPALGELHFQRGLPTEARVVIEEAFNILFGGGHPETGRALARLEFMRAAQGEAGLFERLDHLPDHLQDQAVSEVLDTLVRRPPSLSMAVLEALEERLSVRDTESARAWIERLGEARAGLQGQQHQERERLAELRRGADDLMAQGRLEAAIDLELELARLESWAGRFEPAEQLLRRSLARLEGRGERRLECKVGRALALLLSEQERPEEAMLTAQASLHAAEVCRDEFEEAVCAAVLGVLHLRQARTDRARHYLTYAVALLPPDHPEALNARMHLRSLVRQGGGPTEHPVSQRLRDVVLPGTPEGLIDCLYLDRHRRLRAAFHRRPTREEIDLINKLLRKAAETFEQQLVDGEMVVSGPGLDGSELLLRWN